MGRIYMMKKQATILRDKEEQLGEARSQILANTDQQKEWQQVLDLSLIHI